MWEYLTIIIPQAWMGYLRRGHEGERNNNYCFSKIQLVGQKYQDKTTSGIVKARPLPFCPQKAGAFRYWWAIT